MAGRKTKGPKKPEDEKPEINNEADEAAPEGEEKPTTSQALGPVCWLMMQSEGHKYNFIADLEWSVMPALQLGQFAIFKDAGKPAAFASWAHISPEVAERMRTGQSKLKPQEWRSGNILLLMHFIAPFGGQAEIVKQLKETVLKDQKILTMRATQDGKGLEMVAF